MQAYPLHACGDAIHLQCQGGITTQDVHVLATEVLSKAGGYLARPAAVALSGRWAALQQHFAAPFGQPLLLSLSPWALAHQGGEQFGVLG